MLRCIFLGWSWTWLLSAYHQLGGRFRIVSGQSRVVSSQLDSAWFGSVWKRVPLYALSKQARGYKAFTRQSCPTFPLCASAAGLRCIIHEHSVNLLIQNMSSLFLCLIYCLSFSLSVIPSLCFLLTVFLSLFLLSCSFSINRPITAHGRTQQQIRRGEDEREGERHTWRGGDNERCNHEKCRNPE